MKCFVIGDQHGRDREYHNIVKNLREKHPDCITILNGDTGVGFIQNGIPREFPVIDDRCLINCGNHDDRVFASKYPQFITTWKMLDCGIFVIPGAETPSFDKAYRTEGIDWFAHEQLTTKECQECLDVIQELKPKIIVSHDAPTVFAKILLEKQGLKTFPLSRTRQLLDAIWEVYKPELHIVGHYHYSLEMDIEDTHFVCREELGVYEVDL